MSLRFLTLAVFIVFVAGTVILVFALPGIFSGLARRLPENYTLPYKEAMSRGDHAVALDVAKRRIKQAYYDLNAYYLQAEAEAALGRPDAAVQTIETIFQRNLAASGRIEHAGGFSETKSYRLLSANLWDAGREEDAVDIFRLGVDIGDSQISKELEARARMSDGPGNLTLAAAEVFALQDKPSDVDKVLSTLPDDGVSSTDIAAFWLSVDQVSRAKDILGQVATAGTSQPLALSLRADIASRDRNTTESAEWRRQLTDLPGVTRVALESFVNQANARTRGGELDLIKNGTVGGQGQPSAFGANRLLVRLSGTSAIGVSPLIKVVVNDHLERYIYVDRKGPQTEIIKFSESPQTTPVSIQVHFLNDAFDPATKDDRNVTLLDAWLL